MHRGTALSPPVSPPSVSSVTLLRSCPLATPGPALTCLPPPSPPVAHTALSTRGQSGSVYDSPTREQHPSGAPLPDPPAKRHQSQAAASIGSARPFSPQTIPISTQTYSRKPRFRKASCDPVPTSANVTSRSCLQSPRSLLTPPSSHPTRGLLLPPSTGQPWTAPLTSLSPHALRSSLRVPCPRARLECAPGGAPGSLLSLNSPWGSSQPHGFKSLLLIKEAQLTVTLNPIL